MAVARLDNGRGFGGLLRDLAEGTVSLARDEIKLAKMEIGAMAHAIGIGTLLVAAGAAFAALGGLSLVVGLALLIGDQWLPGDLYWLAALILLVVTGAAALWFAKRGLALVSPRHLTPKETVTTLTEDKEWLKQRLTSAGTSS
ncbi:MAG TPA: phage holin family protein [Gemmatimonadaceae bacterium]